MPLITTHNQFAKDVFTKTNKTITNTFKEKKKIYELFAQGFDPFFFYEFIPFHKKMGNYYHTHYTDTYFLNFIKIIKNEHLTENPSILASLYGHLTHYVLDSTCHPFIIYKTGEYDRTKKETLKYNGKHTKMEMQIDAYLYEQKNKKPFKEFKIHKELISKEKWDKNLVNILNKNYEQVFHIKNGGEKYQKSCHLMYYAYKLLIEDKTGRKTKIYKIVDKFTPKKYGVYANYSTYITNIDKSIFNLEHKIWYNPWDKNIKSTESFFDLYNKALNIAIELVEATHTFIQDKLSFEEYKKILKDNAYTTGFSWKKKEKIKYLEF